MLLYKNPLVTACVPIYFQLLHKLLILIYFDSMILHPMNCKSVLAISSKLIVDTPLIESLFVKNFL